ncbi:MAG: SmpA/OmlA domain protein [Caulobacter sp.]|nr:SmpA/OmlA domain protein [Caulobacter sp.]
MFRPVVFAAAVIGLAAVAGGCTPLTSYSGFQAIEARPADMKVGVDSKSTVTEKLGSPSASSTFDNNTWYYISQTTDRIAFYKPRVVKRDVVAISFAKEDEKVLAVNNYTLKDGKVIAFNGRETPTRGREMTILEQLLGNVGRGGMLPQDDEGVPGTRPGDRR